MTRVSVSLGACLFAACAPPPLAAAPPPAAVPDAAHHVVVVTVDGLRPDAITAADTPNVLRLAREGASSMASRVPQPALTLPSHFGMLTGQTPARHGILKNRTLDAEVPNATLFTAVHATGRRTGLYVGKHKLTALAPRRSADVVAGPTDPGDGSWELGAGTRLAARFAADFPRERFAFALVHLREADMAGHDAGWMTPPYRAALAEADRALGVVLRAIRDSGLPTTLFVTADHGGAGTDHWSHEELDSIVPWICAGPGVKAGTPLAGPSIIDIGPTAAALLGVTLPRVEGRVVKECVP